jgi:hypothetical protein
MITQSGDGTENAQTVTDPTEREPRPAIKATFANPKLDITKS